MHALARGFSRQHRHTNYHQNHGVRITPHPSCGADFPTPQATRLHSNPIRKPSYHSASPHHLTTTHEDPTHLKPPTKKISRNKRAVSTIRFITCRTHTGTGISTRHPSTTPVGLALGPDSPWEDKLHPGTLSHPADMFLTHQSLLMPAFSLAHTPPPVTKQLQHMHDAPLPNTLKSVLPRFRRCT